jgi:hypothetical protein
MFQPSVNYGNTNTVNEGLIIKDLFLQSMKNCEVELNDVFIDSDKSGTPIRLSDRFGDGCLVFRFFGETCNVCIEDVITKMRHTFPDYPDNDKIILLGSNINSRLTDGYYGKNVLSIGYESLGLPAEEYSIPCLFYVDQFGISRSALIPDKAFPELTLAYLDNIKEKFFNY